MELEEVLERVAHAVTEDAAEWERANARATLPLPRLTLTYAQSIDGSIAAERGKPTTLSGASSMKMTHVLRTLHDGILVGIGTVLADNPSLNARLVTGKNPKPIIVDTNLQCPLGIKLFTNPTCEKPILLCAESNDIAMNQRKLALESAGATVLACATVNSSDGQCRIDIRDALARVRREGLRSVMIEGGASIILACLRESTRSHLIDRVIVTIAPTFIGGLHAVGQRISEHGTFPRLVDPSYHQLESDLVVLGRL